MDCSVKDRDFVVPGQLLGEKIRCSQNCFTEEDRVYSQVSGIARVDNNSIKVIPSHGSYIPKTDDLIVGVVVDMTSANWFLDIGQPYRSILPAEEATRNYQKDDLTKYYNIGDIVSAKIRDVDEVYTSMLSRPWKLTDGAIIEVNPQRVSRIIGKKRSMLDMLKEKTGCKIVVGQNGWIWIKGAKQDTTVNTIKKIEAEAHTQGLTSKISRILDEK